jgi:hypothetical protein
MNQNVKKKGSCIIPLNESACNSNRCLWVFLASSNKNNNNWIWHEQIRCACYMQQQGFIDQTNSAGKNYKASTWFEHSQNQPKTTMQQQSLEKKPFQVSRVPS